MTVPTVPTGPTGRTGLCWLGHSTVVLDLDGVRVLTDPLLRRHAGLLRRRGPMPEESSWTGADVVLLSHLHHDHAELGSLRLLGDVPVVTAPANARWLRHNGIAGAIGLHGGDWFEVGPLHVRLAPAEHGHRPMPHRPNAANGHLVRGPSGTVWLAGDTAPFRGMALLPERAGAPLDLAVVPVGGWGPRLSGGHMDPVQAARACATVRARRALAVHWGTLHAPISRSLPPGWMNLGGAAFAVALRRLAPGCENVGLLPGERVELDLRDDAAA